MKEILRGQFWEEEEKKRDFGEKKKKRKRVLEKEKFWEKTHLHEQVFYIRTSTTAFRQQSRHLHYFLSLLSLANQHIIKKELSFQPRLRLQTN